METLADAEVMLRELDTVVDGECDPNVSEGDVEQDLESDTVNEWVCELVTERVLEILALFVRVTVLVGDGETDNVAEVVMERVLRDLDCVCDNELVLVWLPELLCVSEKLFVFEREGVEEQLFEVVREKDLEQLLVREMLAEVVNDSECVREILNVLLALHEPLREHEFEREFDRETLFEGVSDHEVAEKDLLADGEWLPEDVQDRLKEWVCERLPDKVWEQLSDFEEKELLAVGVVLRAEKLCETEGVPEVERVAVRLSLGETLLESRLGECDCESDCVDIVLLLLLLIETVNVFELEMLWVTEHDGDLVILQLSVDESESEDEAVMDPEPVCDTEKLSLALPETEPVSDAVERVMDKLVLLLRLRDFDVLSVGVRVLLNEPEGLHEPESDRVGEYESSEMELEQEPECVAVVETEVDGVGVGVRVLVGVGVGVGEVVGVPVALRVAVQVDVGVEVRLCVMVPLGVTLELRVQVLLPVLLNDRVLESVSLLVGLDVAVIVGVRVRLGVGLPLGVSVVVGVIDLVLVADGELV